MWEASCSQSTQRLRRPPCTSEQELLAHAHTRALSRRYGLKGGDAILASENHLPLYQELVNEYQVSYIAGGAAQNSVRACQVRSTAAEAAAPHTYTVCASEAFVRTLRALSCVSVVAVARARCHGVHWLRRRRRVRPRAREQGVGRWRRGALPQGPRDADRHLRLPHRQQGAVRLYLSSTKRLLRYMIH